jgi:hypothetical protein
MMSVVVSACVLAICVAGCKSNAPTDSGYRLAINHALKANPMCIGSYYTNRFPYQREDKFLDVMVGKGLVTKTAIGQDKVQYEITAAGRATSMYVGMKGLRNGDAYFCYGVREVDNIVSSSKPESVMGHTIVKVTYTWKSDRALPAWAADPRINEGAAAVDPQLQVMQHGATDRQKQTAIAGLIQTDNGWLVPGDTN